ncbi:MAG: PAS domain-containing protein [Brevinematales bacterium]
MGFAGLYFFVLFGLLFLFLWANLTNLKLPATKVLSLNVFLLLVWIFAKLMLVSGIGWESTRFWLQIMTAVSWLLPASLLHFVIEIRRTLLGKVYYYSGIILTYLIPALVCIGLFSVPSLMPSKYIYIGQYVWDGFFSSFFMYLHTLYILVYIIATLSLLAVYRYPLTDIILINMSFFAFFLRTFLLTFDIATYWKGWFFLQPSLALLSYLSLWILYRKNFWFEETFSSHALHKLLKDFSLPILIVKKNYSLWYMNQAMQNLLNLFPPPSLNTSLHEYSHLFTNSDELFDMLEQLSGNTPTTYRLIRIKTNETERSFYTYGEAILLSKKLIAGYVLTFTPLESEKITQLAEKHVKLHKEFESLHRLYQQILQTIDLPLFLTDTSWTITEINAAAYKLLGFNPENTPLIGSTLPLPRIIMEQMKTTESQKFLLEINFGGKEWQKISCQRKDTPVIEFFVKKMENSYLFLLRDTRSLSSSGEQFSFESRFYRHLYHLTIHILQSPQSPPWEKILESFVEIFPSRGYIVSLSEVQNNEIVVPKAVRGADITTIEKMGNLLGGSLFSLPLRIPPHFSMEKSIMLSGKLNKITGGLQELFFYSVNPMITMILEHMISVGDIYAIGISNKETIHALLVIIVKKGFTFQELEWLEPFGEEVSRILEFRSLLISRE